VDLADESVRRKPLAHCVRVEESAINPFRGRSKHSMESDGVCV